MIIDTDKYEELIAASWAAVVQMKHSNNLLAKLLRVGSSSQPLLDAMQRLEKVLEEIE